MDTASLGSPFDPALYNSRKRSFDQTVEDPEYRLYESPVLARQYDRDESLILVGFPSAGKKTLGLIASAALRREFVDFDTIFTGRTGLSPRAYIETHGATAYRNVEDELTSDTFRSRQRGCVLVGFFSMANSRQRRLLKSLSNTNPIVHIQRDLDSIIHRTDSDKDRLYRTYHLSEKMHRRFANFEFFNVSQPMTDDKALGPLRLKATEGEFIRFLNGIFPQSEDSNGLARLFSGSYTYALQVPLSWLDDPQADYTELDSGADAVVILIEMTPKNQQEIFLQLSQKVAVLRKYCHVPIIFDLEMSTTMSYVAQANLLELVIRQAPDIIVVSLDMSPPLAEQLSLAKCHFKIIGKYHQKGPISENWDLTTLRTLLDKANSLHCSSIRLTGEAHEPNDNLGCVRVILEARKLCDLPVSCYNTGEYGRSSICLNPILSPVVLPSQLTRQGVTLADAQRALYSSFWRSKKHFTVFGQDVSYSLTPAMHNAACTACGMPHTCDYVESDRLARIREVFERESQGGLAIVHPYKTEVAQMMDELSFDAKVIGAVNTVVIERLSTNEGSPRLYLKGHNTDHIGIRTCIEKNLSPANAVRSQTSALIIGAGGMARAAIYACIKAGVKNICIFNRTEENARRLADYFATVYTNLRLTVIAALSTPWPTDLWQPTIIVSCIPAHKVGDNDAPDMLIPEHWLRSSTGGVFVEFAYKPLVTRLIRFMQSRQSQGWIVGDGLDVLVEQGIAQFEILTNRPAPSHIMRRTVREQYFVAQSAHRDLLNGHNLNLLGIREPHIYGTKTLKDVEDTCCELGKQHNATVEAFQSNHEDQLINRIHEARNKVDLIVIYPAGYTHASVAIRGALLGVSIPFIEVHISNVHAREQWRNHSYFSDKAVACIVGLGTFGYEVAIQHAVLNLSP